MSVSGTKCSCAQGTFRGIEKRLINVTLFVLVVLFFLSFFPVLLFSQCLADVWTVMIFELAFSTIFPP